MKHINESKSELQRIRREWRLQQQQMEVHQRRKEILIREYEIQRKCRLKQSSADMCLFKGSEGTQMNSTELQKIKVDIYRNIPGKSAANELQRNIVNPEDVMVKRREGEGSKPIFEREELTKAVSNTEDDYRRVVTVKGANTENKLQTSKKRSASLSLTRTRSHSHRQTSSRHSRHEDYRQDEKENRRSNDNRGHTRNRSRERKDGRRTQSCHVGDEETRLKERSRVHLRSRERDRAKLDRDSHHSNKSIRGRSRERRMPSQQVPIAEQVGIPIYCGKFPPRPIMVELLVPFRGQIAFGGSRHLMWPMRPFGPRFPPGIDMYRLRSPKNPRGFGPQY